MSFDGQQETPSKKPNCNCLSHESCLICAP